MGDITKKDKLRFSRFCKLNSATNCLEWTGTLRTGYGRFYLDGKWLSAHRVSWEIHNGPIENGLLVLHKCDNRKCVNPDHLFLGTQKDNMYDMIKKNRNKVLKGSDNPCSKLNEEQVVIIRDSYSNGNVSYRRLADEFDVSPKLIELVVKREVWRHV